MKIEKSVWLESENGSRREYFLSKSLMKQIKKQILKQLYEMYGSGLNPKRLHAMFDDFNDIIFESNIVKQPELGHSMCNYFVFYYGGYPMAYRAELHFQTKDGSYYLDVEQEIDPKNVDLYVIIDEGNDKFFRNEINSYIGIDNQNGNKLGTVYNDFKFPVIVQDIGLDFTFKFTFDEQVSVIEKEKIISILAEAQENHNDVSLADANLEMGLIHSLSEGKGANRKSKTLEVHVDLGSSGPTGYDYLFNSLKNIDNDNLEKVELI